MLLGDPLVPRVWSAGWVCWVELFRDVQESVGDARASESELIFFFFPPLENSEGTSILTPFSWVLFFPPSNVGFT